VSAHSVQQLLNLAAKLAITLAFIAVALFGCLLAALYGTRPRGKR
jgi:hypothetical protein